MHASIIIMKELYWSVLRGTGRFLRGAGHLELLPTNVGRNYSVVENAYISQLYDLQQCIHNLCHYLFSNYVNK